MFNYTLPLIPNRSGKPRDLGVTMVMDKGLSLGEAEMMLESSAHLIDLVKLGFGTSYVTPKLKEKIALYKSANIRTYLGGTLFEAFIVRDMLEDYIRLIDDVGIDTVEVSDGSIVIPHEQKCEIIARLSKNYRVLSEVGSKEAGILISPGKWISMMTSELEAGSW